MTRTDDELRALVARLQGENESLTLDLRKAQQDLAQITEERDRETELRRTAEAHNRDLREYVGRIPYSDEWEDVVAEAARYKAALDAVQAVCMEARYSIPCGQPHCDCGDDFLAVRVIDVEDALAAASPGDTPDPQERVQPATHGNAWTPGTRARSVPQRNPLLGPTPGPGDTEAPTEGPVKCLDCGHEERDHTVTGNSCLHVPLCFCPAYHPPVPAQEPGGSEPATCEHGRTEPHRMVDTSVRFGCRAVDCPGPVQQQETR